MLCVSGLDNLADNDLFAVYAVKLTSLHNCTWNCWPEQNICESVCKLIFQWESFFCLVWFGRGGGVLEWIFFTIFCSWIFYTCQTFTWSEVFSKLRKITEIYRIFKSLFSFIICLIDQEAAGCSMRALRQKLLQDLDQT